MRNIYFFVFMFFVALLAMDGCKRDPAINKVVNSDADSLYAGTKYKLPTDQLFRFPPVTNPYADSMTVEGVALGRRLFYDKHLSADGQTSCASCHHLVAALSDSGHALSTNEFGLTKRNAPALINLAWAPYFFWDGRSKSLAAQAQDAYHNELGLVVTTAIVYLQTDTTDVKLFKKAFGRPGTITDVNIYKAIQQFLMTAISSNSKYDLYLQNKASFSPSEQNGLRLFNTETGDCFHCHMSDGGYTLLMTDNLFRNTGLENAATVSDFSDPGRGAITLNQNDYGTFKDPTLRNIALTGPYMHDGRFATLEQVINFYSDSTQLSPTVDPLLLTVYHNYGAGLHLAASDKTDLLNFLYTLTDTSFINNPAFSSPF